MDISLSAARLLPRYWLLLTLAIIAPMTVVGAFAAHSPPTYTARTRLLAAPTVPQAQAQADAEVSQVQAVATSREVVATALATVGIVRDPAAVTKAISVAGVGSSGLVDLSYTDTSPTVAQRVDAAVASLVVARLLALRAGVPELVQTMSGLTAQITADRAALAGTAHPSARTQALLISIDDLVSDLTAAETRLAGSSVNGSSVAIVDTATVPPADGTALVAKLGIALLLGLAFGLLVVGANESLRPRVAGATRVARLLDTAVLGSIGSDFAAMSQLGRRLRLRCRRDRISSVVVVRADGTPVAPELVSRLRTVTFAAAPLPRQWSSDSPDTDDNVDVTADPKAPHDAPDGTPPARLSGTSVARIVRVAAPETFRTGETRLRRLVALDDLDTAGEGDRIGVVVTVGPTTRMYAIAQVRDLVETTGWPVLGVLNDPQNRSGM
jgi:capsular polysaccharide biosynthesis protein